MLVPGVEPTLTNKITIPEGVSLVTMHVDWSLNLSASTAESLILAVVTALAWIFTAATMSEASVVVNEPVPLPVTAPVSVMVWSPVLVPELVPEKEDPLTQVPVAVERLPRPKVARCSAAEASAISALPAAVQAISSTVPPPEVLRPRTTSVVVVS